jgi:hypothetical protein
MSNAHANWWMDARCRWHQGAPPPGWWQARNGRWHPPEPPHDTTDRHPPEPHDTTDRHPPEPHDTTDRHPPEPHDTTETLAVGPPLEGAHFANPRQGANLWQTYRSWPRWARLAGPAVALILVVGLLGAAATKGLREGARETTATSRVTTTTQAETPATSPNVVTPAPSAGGSTPTSSVPRTTAPPQPAPTPTTAAADPAPGPPTTADPPTNDIHPGAPCSPEGATAVMGDGTSVLCTTEKCHGAPFSQPRWRRASC